MTKQIKYISFGFLISILASACASKGFHREALVSQVGVDTPVYDNKDIEVEFAKKANLPKPFKLAVYFKHPESLAKWRWSEDDRAKLDSITDDLKAQGLVSEVFPLIDSLVTDDSLPGLRMLAARHHADALLIVGGASEIDRYINGWGWTYVLLAPALFVPGSRADTLFLTHAALWDVRNEFLYMTAQAEATTTDNYIAAFGKKDRELIDEAKGQALDNLKTKITKMVSATRTM